MVQKSPKVVMRCHVILEARRLSLKRISNFSWWRSQIFLYTSRYVFYVIGGTAYIGTQSFEAMWSPLQVDVLSRKIYSGTCPGRLQYYYSSSINICERSCSPCTAVRRSRT